MTTTPVRMEWTPPQDKVNVSHYVKPELSGEKENVKLERTLVGSVNVQVMADGGENNLHSHATSDGFWYVLRGGIRFYTVDDAFVIELKEGDTFVTPRRYKYWFEAVPGKDDLELIRFGASAVPIVSESIQRADRVNHEVLKANQLRLIAKQDDLPYELLEQKA